MQSIEIDNDVLSVIKAGAEPFVDTPNSVLRRLLGIEAGAPPKTGGTVGKADRAPLGSLLPESEYEIPILEELAKRGGSVPAREITKAVGDRLSDRLTDLDREHLNSGDVRWENRVHFTRMTLKNRGLLKADSPRGVWEISDAGRDYVEGQGQSS